MKNSTGISADIPNDFPTINRRQQTKLTPSSRILPKMLTVPQPFKYFPACYGTRRFITASTSALHLSPLRSRMRQSVPLSHFPKTHFNIIFQSTPMSSTSSFPLTYLYQNTVSTLLSPLRATRPAQLIFSLFDHPNYIRCAAKIIALIIMYQGAEKSLARPTSRCRRTDSIVLEANLLLRSNNICFLQTLKNL